MFIYFDRNGVLQEVINDKAARLGDLNANEIYVYVDEVELDDIWLTLKRPDGTLSVEKSFIANKVVREIPYDPKRDMKFFKDFKEYEFYKFTISDEITIEGVYQATIRMTYEDTLSALGVLVFKAETGVIKSDQNITQAQYDYLIWYVGSWQGQIGDLEEAMGIAQADILNLQQRMNVAEQDINKIEDGTTVVSKALKDDLGNTIKSTYANKLDLVYSSINNRIAITLKSYDGNSIDADLIDLPKATTSADGLLSKEDKVKINNIASDIASMGATKQNLSEKNQINGYAGLDANAKIPSSLLPDSVLGQLEYKGTFTPTAYPSSPEKGWFYISIGNGTIGGVDFQVGDWAVFNGSTWDKVDNTDAVMSVNGKIGVVVLNGTDIKVGNGDTWTIEQRIVNIYAELNNRYTKAQTYSQTEIEQRITDLLGMANLQDILIGSYTNEQTILASDLSAYNFVIVLGKDVNNTYTGTFKPSEIVSGNIISLSPTVYLTRGATDFTITTPTSVKLWGIKLDGITADEIGYDGTISGLSSTNVKTAIDELSEKEFTNSVPNMTSRTGFWTNYETGIQTSTGSYFEQKIIINPKFSKIMTYAVATNTFPAVIAFYNSDTIFDGTTYMKIESKQFTTPNNTPTKYYANVPNGCKAIIITSRNDVGDIGVPYTKCSIDFMPEEVLKIDGIDLNGYEESLVLVGSSGAGNTTNFVSPALKGDVLKIVVEQFNFSTAINMNFLSTSLIGQGLTLDKVGTYYIQLHDNYQSSFVSDTLGNIVYKVYKIKNLYSYYQKHNFLKDYFRINDNFISIDFFDIPDKRRGVYTNINGVGALNNSNNRVTNEITIPYSNGILDVAFNDINEEWRVSVVTIKRISEKAFFVARNSYWKTANFSMAITDGKEIAVVIAKRNDANFLVSDVPQGLVVLDLSKLYKNKIDAYSLKKELKDIDTRVANIEENTKSDFLYLQKNIFGKNKQYSHIFINDIYDVSNPKIPCQSSYDLALAKRLGYNIVEANVQKTATVGKYVVMHGVSGTVGGQLIYNNGDSANSVIIENTSFDDLRNNFKYKSIYTKYQTKIISLEEWCGEVKKLGLMPLVQYRDETSLNIVKSYFGTDFILYGGTRSNHSGMIMKYSNTFTKEQMITMLELEKAPMMINVSSLSNFTTDAELQEAIQEVHKRGGLFGICGCYMSAADAIRAYRCGADFSASDSEVNPFDDGDIYNLSGELDFGDFITNGVITNNTISLTAGQTITVPPSSLIPFAHKSRVLVVYNGALTIEICGRRNPTNIISNGEEEIEWSGFAINQAPYLTITANDTTIVKSIRFIAKKV